MKLVGCIAETRGCVQLPAVGMICLKTPRRTRLHIPPERLTRPTMRNRIFLQRSKKRMDPVWTFTKPRYCIIHIQEFV